MHVGWASGLYDIGMYIQIPRALVVLQKRKPADARETSPILTHVRKFQECTPIQSQKPPQALLATTKDLSSTQGKSLHRHIAAPTGQ